ncbi:conserved hypothetical protein [Coccidioides posadasii str. Silveira]|uniref:Uncharacterized protein n=1 Tax=Coccidioides posadasii (strain RMSCC 757 / Silveira) TaxID=443226 RepID=E9CZY0_COCPS|nr:conserved hypothetical protein [Coccidioides posadasii str. Silveira]
MGDQRELAVRLLVGGPHRLPPQRRITGGREGAAKERPLKDGRRPVDFQASWRPRQQNSRLDFQPSICTSAGAMGVPPKLMPKALLVVQVARFVGSGA